MSMTDFAPARTPVHPVLWIMVAAMAGFELMFAAADAGYLPESLSRTQVYLRFAFFGIEEHGGQYMRVFGELDGRVFAEPLGPAAAWSEPTRMCRVSTSREPSSNPRIHATRRARRSF